MLQLEKNIIFRPLAGILPNFLKFSVKLSLLSFMMIGNLANSQTWNSSDITINRSDATPTVVDPTTGAVRITGSNTDTWKGTAFWYNTPINLTQDFNLCFETFFGCDDAGADGMVFVLQNDPRGLNAIGAAGGPLCFGGGIGGTYGRITPSIGIEFDTYDNTAWGVPDIPQDHTTVDLNGDERANQFPPIPIGKDPIHGADGNVEDCFQYSYCISWKASTHVLTVKQNGTDLIFNYTKDMINTIFGGNPIVYWGWTGSTGANANEQWVAPAGSVIPWQCKVASCCTTYTVNTIPATYCGTPVTIGVTDTYMKYNWSTGDNTQNITVNAVGTYTVNVTQNQGGYLCPGSASIDVTPSPAITLTSTKTNVSCFGGNNGSATITPSGGTPGFSYLWNVGGASSTKSSLTAGTYTVTVSDANNCSTTKSITITQPTLLTATINPINITCNGAANGAATATPSGGTSPYTYLWSGGGAAATKSPLAPGTYTVTVTDAKGCTATKSTTITEAPSLSTSITQTNVNCNGASTGSATIIPSGGAIPYTYLWTGGGVAATKSSLAAGTYTVTVTDANSCTTTKSVTITAPTLLTATTSQTNLLCNGDNSGTSTINPSGGTLPYSYLWTGGTTTPTKSGLSAGAYNITVTDANSCSLVKTITITAPTLLTATTLHLNVLCNGDASGSSTVSASGGTLGYTYLWTGGTTTATKSGLLSGTYNVTVTDANSCTAIASVLITQPALLGATTTKINVLCKGNATGTSTVTAISGTPGYSYLWTGGTTTATKSGLIAGIYTVTVTDANACTATTSVMITEPTLLIPSLSQTNVLCNGNATGSSTVTVLGGTAGYTYLWTGGTTTSTKSGLTAGNYTVTVSDANACTATASVIITAPTLLSASTTQTNVLCNGVASGSATVTATGGIPLYTYLWTGGTTTPTKNGLGTGTYNVTVTDMNSCTVTASIIITAPLPLTATIATTDAHCNGVNDGSVTLTPNGGTLPYTYYWNNTATTKNLTNVSSGNYIVTITDNHGCTQIANATVNQPNGLNASITNSGVLCNGNNNGSLSVAIVGGTSPYTYLWSGGGSTSTKSGLTAGTYTLTVSDFNNCSTTATGTITEPLALIASTVQSNVNCNGGSDGSITVNALGGTLPYTYLWTGGTIASTKSGINAGTYSVTITDNHLCTLTKSVIITEPLALSASTTQINVDCNGNSNGSATITALNGTPPYSYLWSDGTTNSTKAGLSAGNYTVTVSDNHSCTVSKLITITQPLTLGAGTTQTNVDCNGNSNGSATITPTNGTLPYSYLWSDGTTTATKSGLTAGTYTITIRDSHSCTVSQTITITQPIALSAGTIQTNVNCNGGSDGSATINALGGTSPYTYLWTGGTTISTKSGLTAGNYTVTITDNHLCTITKSVIITEPLALSASTTQINVDCNGNSNGSATITALNGTAPYSYLWTGGTTTATKTGLTVGNYTVTVSDNHSCTVSKLITITQPLALGVATTQTNVDCNGNSNGSATITPSNGTSPYSYLWSDGTTTATKSGLAAGTYTITIRDSHSCTVSQTITITQPLALSASTIQTNVNCNGGSDGSASINVLAGTFPYTYLWTGGTTASTKTGLSSGNYTVTVTDNHLCTLTKLVIITEPLALSASITQINVDCNGNANGSSTVTVINGTAPYSYLWTGGTTTATKTGLTVGNYTVTVSDNHSCTVSKLITITQPLALSVATTQTNVDCNGNSNGSATITPSNGTSPYSYLWSDGTTTAIKSGLASGTYTITIRDSHACTISQTITITQPIALNAGTIQTNVNCNGGSDGSITINAIGGSTPYNYLWTGGTTISTKSGLTSGNYSVTVTDNHLCSLTKLVTITEPLALSASTTQINVDCNGNTNGSSTLTALNGTAPYSYLWSGGTTTATKTGLSAGNYSVTITDNHSCTVSATIIITSPLPLTATSTTTDAHCNGVNDGTVTLTPNGGTLPYTYIWNNTATTINLTNVSSGTYIVTITDNHGCAKIANATVNQPNGLNASITNSGVLCNGNNNGSLSVAIVGGTSPYNYLWSGGGSSSTKSGLTAGTYTITVSDFNNCSTTAIGIITEPIALSASTVQTNVNCNGGFDGSSTINVLGGTSPYTYLWTGGTTTSTKSGLTAGTYSVTVTDNHLCTLTKSVIITEPLALSASSSQINVDCNGNTNGSATVTALNGTSPYSYLWPDGTTTATKTGLSAGNYTVTISDNHSCTFSKLIAITQPLALGVATTQTNVDCNGNSTGSATVIPSNGTSPYTYLWTDGTTSVTKLGLTSGTYRITIRDSHNCTATQTIIITEPSLLNASTTQINVDCNGNSTGSATVIANNGISPYTYLWTGGTTASTKSGLSSGNYTVTVTDNHNCTLTQSITITQPLAISSTTSSKDVDCNGNSTGALTVSAINGTLPYQFLWTNGSTSSSISNIVAGNYTVTITDGHNCISTKTGTVSEPTPIMGSAIVTNITLNGSATGAISINNSGGTIPYTYNWSNGTTDQNLINVIADNYEVTITDHNGCTTIVTAIITEASSIVGITIPTGVQCKGGSDGSVTLNMLSGTPPFTFLWNNGRTTQNLNNVIAGTYYVTVNDVFSNATIIKAIVSEPETISATSTQTNIDCNGNANGSATVSAIGGTIPYTYLWTGGSITQTISGITNGIYTVTITDNHNCTLTQSVVISQPLSLTASTTTMEVDCYGNSSGSATVKAIDGTPSYTYLWDNGDITPTVSNLVAGTYTVTVTDNHHCITIANAVISQPDLLNGSVTITNITLNGSATGSANLSNFGGTPAYSYHWSNGTTDQNIHNVLAGTYTVTITDKNGCSTEITAIITEVPGIKGKAVPNDVSCFGGSDGNVIITMISGNPPYTYLWDNGATTKDLINVKAKAYKVTVTDLYGNSTIISSAIIQPIPLVATILKKDVECFGNASGEAIVTASGGTSDYSYEWNIGDLSASISQLTSGNYTVTVTDSHNCTTTALTTITQPLKLGTTIITNANVKCLGGNEGSLTVNALQGTSPYTYLWSNNESTKTISNLTAGHYTVTVTDNNHCTSISLSSITQNQLPTAVLYGDTTICKGSSAIINFDMTGVPPFNVVYKERGTIITKTFTQNSIPILVTPAVSSDYALISISDANCTGIVNTTPSTVNISNPQLNLFTINVKCKGGYGELLAQTTGGIPPYNYQLVGVSPSSLNYDFTGLIASATPYQVEVTDAKGCTAIENATISEPSALIISSIIPNEAHCTSNNGNATVSVQGGTLPYRYLWSNSQTTSKADELFEGSYSVTITDNNDCTVTTLTYIHDTGKPHLMSTTLDVTCAGNLGANGEIHVTANGGIRPYTYSWIGLSSHDSTLTALSEGYYTAIVKDEYGCIDTALIKINKLLGLNISIITTKDICNQSYGSAMVTANGGSGNYTYRWDDNNNSTTKFITGLRTRKENYNVTVTDQKQCKGFASTSIENLGNIEARINPVSITTDLLSPTVKLYDKSVGDKAIEWEWNFGEDIIHTQYGDINNRNNTSSEENPNHTYQYPGTYKVRLIVHDQYCSDTTYSTVFIDDVFTIFISNTFTPNGDNVNENWGPKGSKIDLATYSCEIYDRWGELIFKTNDFYNTWNGRIMNDGDKLCKQDIYVYVIKFNSNTGKQYNYTGNIQLIY